MEAFPRLTFAVTQWDIFLKNVNVYDSVSGSLFEKKFNNFCSVGDFKFWLKQTVAENQRKLFGS